MELLVSKHNVLSGTKMMQLDNTGAASTQCSLVNSTMPTTSVVELVAGAATNTSRW